MSSPATPDGLRSISLDDDDEEDAGKLKSNNEVPSDKFMTSGIWLLYCVVAADAMSLSIVAPFVADLLRHRVGIAENQVGLMGGIALSSFHFARFASSWLLGSWSDRSGRKIVIITGLLASFASLWTLALSHSFALVLASRFFGGLLNSNSTIARAALSDLTTVNNRGVAFAFLGAAFGVSRALSSALSGLTVGLNIPGPWGDADAYFAPCFLSSVITLVMTVIFALCWTSPPIRPSKKDGGVIAGLKEAARDPVLGRCFVINAVISFCNSAMILAIVLVSALNNEDGGLGFSPKGIGATFSIFGLCMFLCQVLLMKRFLRRFGLRVTGRACAIMLGSSTLLLPVISFVTNLSETPSWLIFVAIPVFALCLSLGFMGGLPITTTCIANATADPTRVGLVQGSAQSMASFARALGPLITGSLFSFSLRYHAPYVVFVFLASLYYLCAYLNLSLPESVEKGTAVPDQELVEKKGLLEAEMEDDDVDEDVEGGKSLATPV